MTPKTRDTPEAAGPKGYPVRDTLPGNVEVADEGSMTQAAFWQLLKDAGYDT